MSFFDDEVNRVISETEQMASSQSRPANLLDLIESLSGKYRNNENYSKIFNTHQILKNKKELYLLKDKKLEEFVLKIIIKSQNYSNNKIDINFLFAEISDFLKRSYPDFCEKKHLEYDGVLYQKNNRIEKIYEKIDINKENKKYVRLSPATKISFFHPLTALALLIYLYIRNNYSDNIVKYLDKFGIYLIIISIFSILIYFSLTKLRRNHFQILKKFLFIIILTLLIIASIVIIIYYFSQNSKNTGHYNDNINQKIIWEFNGGYMVQRGAYQSDDGMFFVPPKCRKLSENLNRHLEKGWKIVSSSPSERFVYGGVCQGREVVIER